MPAMHYHLRWPDGSETACYSPSLVIQDYVQPGTAYPLADFLRRIREATGIANERVRAKYGFACSQASDTLARIEARAAALPSPATAHIEVIAFDLA